MLTFLNLQIDFVKYYHITSRLDGEPDRRQWGPLLRDRFLHLFGNEREAQEVRIRWEAVRSAIASRRLEGLPPPRPPGRHLMSVVGRVRTAAAPGPDGVPPALVCLLHGEASLAIEEAFAHRLRMASCQPAEETDPWRRARIVCLPKPNKPATTLTNWRPITLAGSFAKLYEAWLWRELADNLPPLPACFVGFVPGRQALEIPSALATLLAKAAEWGLPLAIVSLDVHAAFDHLSPARLDEELRLLGLPAHLRAGLLHEVQHLQAEVTLGPVSGGAVPIQQGMRQGGPGTPAAWTRLLQRTVQGLLETWREEEDAPVEWCAEWAYPVLLYADNLYLVGSSVGPLSRRVSAVLARFTGLGLQFSDTSLEVLANGPMATPGDWWISARRFRAVTTLVVLGVALDARATPETMVEHRIRCAEGTWRRHSAALCGRGLPMGERWKWWQGTVGASLLWGAGLWRSGTGIRRRLEALETNHARRMVHIVRHSGEDWLCYYRRRRARITSMWDDAGRTPSFVRHLVLVHTWAGHVVRDPVPIARIPRQWRNESWWQTLQVVAGAIPARLQGSWRHPARNWARGLEHLLAQCHGAQWHTLAERREEWRGQQDEWVRWCVARFGGPLPPHLTRRRRRAEIVAERAVRPRRH